MLVDLAVRVRERRFLFDSVAAVAVCLWGSRAGWTELNGKQRRRTLTARSPSFAMCKDTYTMTNRWLYLFKYIFAGGYRSEESTMDPNATQTQHYEDR